jgi:hypothetical protein
MWNGSNYDENAPFEHPLSGAKRINDLWRLGTQGIQWTKFRERQNKSEETSLISSTQKSISH